MTEPHTASIPLDHAQRWRAFWVCAAVAAFTILDMSKVNVGLPAIEATTQASSTQLQLVISGYILTFGLALVPFGRLGDQRSRKMLFVIGLGLFTAASALCGFAPTIEVLLVGRFLQGLAAGMQMPQVMGTIQQLFLGAERGKAFGLFGAVIGIATAFGPTFGGLLIALGGPTDGWRWIFWVNVPFCLLLLWGIVRLLPQTRTPTPGRVQLDPIGILLFAGAIVALMWPFLFTTGSPDDDPLRWWVLVLFALLAVAFFAWERRYAAAGKQPLILFRLFRLRSFRNGTLVIVLYFTAAPALFLLTTLFLQIGVGLAPVFAGMVSIGFAVASAVTSWYGGLLVARMGREIVTGGLAVVLVSVVVLGYVAYTMPAETVAYGMAAVMLVAGAGAGLVIAPNQTLTLSEVPVREGGLAGSIGQLGQRVGGAVGTAVALSFFYATIFREADTGLGTLEVYHDAYAFGLLPLGVILALALAASIADMVAERRAARV